MCLCVWGGGGLWQIALTSATRQSRKDESVPMNVNVNMSTEASPRRRL